MTSELDLLDLSEAQKENIARLAVSMQSCGIAFVDALRAIANAFASTIVYTPLKELIELSDQYSSLLEKNRKKERYERRYARRKKK